MPEKKANGANLGFENQLWAAADKLRGHMDASEYKHVVLGLIFLKYISDAFQSRYKQLEATKDTEYTDPEDRDEYAAANIFWVPKEARWSILQSNARQPTIGKLVDDAMVAIEKENPTLKGVLPKDHARPSLDKYRLGELIDIISNINLKPSPDFQPPSPSGRGSGGKGLRARTGETLFIDARKLGALIDRTHKELSDEEIEKIAGTYHAWRNSESGMVNGENGYQDMPGFCKSATLAEIRDHGYVLTPGRYVGAAEIEDDGVPFEEKMAEPSATLYEQFAEADRLEAVIKRNLEVFGDGE